LSVYIHRRPIQYRTFVAHRFSRILVIGAIIVGHALLVELFMNLDTHPRSHSNLQADVQITAAQFVVQSVDRDGVPLPEVQLDTVPVGLNDLKLIQFEDPDQYDLSSIVGSASAPRLARVQEVQAVDFARRAHIELGHPKTILLSVEVREDGTVGSIDVARSSGDPVADEAAIDYALSLHWIPGTADHEPRSMRVILPVTLFIPL
jgi:TonB family protein